MSANDEDQQIDLVDAAVDWLDARLPEGWAVERSTVQIGGANGRDPHVVDPVITVRGANAGATFAVEARESISPRDVERMMAGLSRTFRGFSNAQILLVAPWISARSQELLRKEDISYIDLTGNAWIRSDYPALWVQGAGAARNPAPAVREPARLRGAKAGRLVRTLVDVSPPYRGLDLAAATGLNPGYVSRLLEALDRDALIDRARRGEVLSVDYPALLRRWVQTYDVLRSNEARRFIAPDGVRSSLARLRSIEGAGRCAVTGSFAAGRLAPIAAPALLLLYADDLGAIREALDLLPADEGADVVLLRPFDEVVWTGLDHDDGIAYVAPSQGAADCLTGSGRMPAEGEALVAWMIENQAAWRRPSLPGLAGGDLPR